MKEVAQTSLSPGENIWVQKAKGGNNYSYGAGLVLDENAVYVNGLFGGTAELPTQGGTEYIKMNSNNEHNGFVDKISAVNGDAIWANYISGDTYDAYNAAYYIAVNGSGIYVTGDFKANVKPNNVGYLTNSTPPYDGAILKTSAGGRDAYLAKYDKNNGDMIWLKTFGDEQDQLAVEVVTDESNVHVAGFFWGEVDFNSEGTSPVIRSAQGYASDIFLAKYKETTPTAAPGGAVAGQLVIYPNPATDRLYVELEGQSLVQVLSVTGQMLRRAVLPDGNQAISLEGLPQRYYLLKIASGTASVTKPFLKR